jgi:hypothetical protein
MPTVATPVAESYPEPHCEHAGCPGGTPPSTVDSLRAQPLSKPSVGFPFSHSAPVASADQDDPAARPCAGAVESRQRPEWRLDAACAPRSAAGRLGAIQRGDRRARPSAPAVRLLPWPRLRASLGSGQSRHGGPRRDRPGHHTRRKRAADQSTPSTTPRPPSTLRGGQPVVAPAPRLPLRPVSPGKRRKPRPRRRSPDRVRRCEAAGSTPRSTHNDEGTAPRC